MIKALGRKADENFDTGIIKNCSAIPVQRYLEKDKK
jgi:hypothetical protein